MKLKETKQTWYFILDELQPFISFCKYLFHEPHQIILHIYALIDPLFVFQSHFQPVSQFNPSNVFLILHSFGLITVTHSRQGNYSFFENHLDYYASMECPLLIEIAIVWNNDDEPEDHDFVKRENWKRPVYFNKTPYDSMDFRYNLPIESKASVFFSIDDDVNTTCSELMKSFKIYQENSIGDLGPIVSFGTRGYDFNSRAENFKYMDPLKAQYYTMSLIGISWISRFYMEIYTSTRCWEVNRIREIVRRKNNCDDIALNYIINFFFPEFRTLYSESKYELSVFPISQGKSKTHYKFRNECLKEFTDIFGFNPLRLVSRAGQKNESKFESETAKYSVYLKRKEIYEKLIKEESVEKQKEESEALATFQIGEMQKTLQGQTSPEKNEKVLEVKEANGEEIKALEQIKRELEDEKLRSKLILEEKENLQAELSKNEKEMIDIMRGLNTIKLVSFVAGFILIAILILSNLHLITFGSRSNTENENIQLNSEVVNLTEEQQ